MFCSQCGNNLTQTIQAGGKFCPQCGTPVPVNSTPVAPAPVFTEAPQPVNPSFGEIETPVVQDAPTESVVTPAPQVTPPEVEPQTFAEPEPPTFEEAPIVVEEPAPVEPAVVEPAVETPESVVFGGEWTPPFDQAAEDVAVATPEEAPAPEETPAPEVPTPTFTIGEAPPLVTPTTTINTPLESSFTPAAAPVPPTFTEPTYIPPVTPTFTESTYVPPIAPTFSETPPTQSTFSETPPIIPPVSTTFEPTVPAEPPKKKKTWLLILIIAIVVVGLAVAFFVFIFPKLGGGGGSIEKNPLGAAYTGLQEVTKFEKGLDLTIKLGSEYEDIELTSKIFLGADLNSSAIDIRSEDLFRFIMVDGSFALANYGDFDDPYDFIGYENVIDTVTMLFEDEMDISFDFNKIVKDGKFDTVYIAEQATELSDLLGDTLTDDYLYGADYSDILNDGSTKVVTETIDTFFTDKCGDAKFTESFITNKSTSKANGNTTVTFTLDLPGTLTAYGDYLGEVANDDKYLKDHDITKKDVLAAQSEIKLAVSSLEDEYEYDEDLIKTIDITVTVDKSNKLKELGFTFVLYDDEGSIFLTIDSIGSSSLDVAKLSDFMDDVYLEDFEDLLYGDYDYDYDFYDYY